MFKAIKAFFRRLFRLGPSKAELEQQRLERERIDRSYAALGRSLSHTETLSAQKLSQETKSL